MQLLVSVRSAAEVEPALAGGADIIDAKEPGRGALGPVSPDTLAEILAQVPRDRACSVALGDLPAPREVLAALGSLNLPARSASIFLKIGFAGARSEETVSRLIGCAAAGVAKEDLNARVVAVAYADTARAQTLSPYRIARLAHQAGAEGVLLDTHTKDGRGLLQWLTPNALADWVSTTRRLGLLTALAGEIGLADIEAILRAGPDVLGVRGAACEGGRGGRVTAERVWAFRRSLEEPSAYVPTPWARGTMDLAKRPRVGRILPAKPGLSLVKSRLSTVS